MQGKLISVEEAAEIVQSGRPLAIAGDLTALQRLPRGAWIGGTIPYFVGEAGGRQSRDLVFVQELQPAHGATVTAYGTADIAKIATDARDDELTVLILPGMSDIHLAYAKDARGYPDMFLKPIVGWIAGCHLDDLGKVRPAVIDGATGSVYTDRGVALRVRLPEGSLANVRIANLFRQGDGDTFAFPDDGFSADECLVNGQRASFYDYVKGKQIDLQLPLVADYNGAQINTSFQGFDDANRRVLLYAPVFRDVEYRLAAPVGAYHQAFAAVAAEVQATEPTFACNCILNYLYGSFEGQPAVGFRGPMTFGEIAWQLLNQTMVYVEVV